MSRGGLRGADAHLEEGPRGRVPLEGMACGGPPEGEQVRGVDVRRAVVEERLGGEKVLGAIGVRGRPFAECEVKGQGRHEEERHASC